MRNNFLKTIILSCVVTSCHVDDLGKIKPGTISPHIALNLGYSEYTVQELLEDLDDESAEVTTNEDQTMAIYFSEHTVYDDSDELIAISSVENQEEFAPSVNVPSTAPGYEIDIDETFKFSFPANNGEIVDSLFYNSGTLDFEMLSTFKGDIDYTWTIEGTRVVSTNLDLTNTTQLEYTSGDVTDSYSRPLEGLKSKFYKNDSDENEFQVRVVGTITFDPGTEVLPAQKMTFDLAFNNPEFSKIYGKFGSDPIGLQDQSIDMTSFNDFSGNGLEFEDPRVYLITHNSYGMDMELNFDEFKAIDSEGNEKFLEEQGTGIDGFVSSPDVEGEMKIDTVELTKENSNIDDLLNATPVSMEFEITGIPNPGSSERSSNFLLEDSKVEIESLIAIPMQFRMDGFAVDFDFEISDLDDIETAENLIFNVTSTNEIPFEGNIDLMFVDSDGNVLHELKDATSIEAPSLDASGRVLEPKVSTKGINLSQEGIDALINAEKILATANISTFEHENGRFVTLYSDYTLNIDLSISGEITIQL